MVEIPQYHNYNDERRLAILDNSSIAFLESMDRYSIRTNEVLKDYDAILIPLWVWREVKTSDYRLNYIERLINTKIPIYLIDETSYPVLAKEEEGHLFSIVKASMHYLPEMLKYLKKHVETDDVLDLPDAKEWLQKLYKEWPLSNIDDSGLQERKPNAGEISIAILAIILLCYYPEIEILTIYSQDRDTYRFHGNAKNVLEKDKNFFADNIPAVAYKSNDVILQQLYMNDLIELNDVNTIRKDSRVVLYTKHQEDCSTYLIKDKLDNRQFIELIQNKNVHIIF